MFFAFSRTKWFKLGLFWDVIWDTTLFGKCYYVDIVRIKKDSHMLEIRSLVEQNSFAAAFWPLFAAVLARSAMLRLKVFLCVFSTMSYKVVRTRSV